MDWLKLVLTFAAGVINFLQQRQLVEAGQAEIAKKGLEQSMRDIANAKRNRDSVTDADVGELLRNPKDRGKPLPPGGEG